MALWISWAVGMAALLLVLWENRRLERELMAEDMRQQAAKDSVLKAVEAMERLVKKSEAPGRDLERIHAEADDTLIALLRFFGCADLCDLYEKLDKWYA